MEQIPEGRDMAEVEEEIDSTCCLCHKKWTVYRGQYSCASKLCGVPVIVCTGCTQQAHDNPQDLQCDLCQENYRLSTAQPDLAEIKRKAEENATKSRKKSKHTVGDISEREHYPDRLFVSRLPLTATVTKLKQTLLPTNTNTNANTIHRKKDNEFRVHWLTDPHTNAFYGSCIVQMPNASAAAEVIKSADTNNNNSSSSSNNNNKGADQKKGLRMDKKRIKVSYVWKKENLSKEDGKKSLKSKDVFAASSFEPREYPPIQ